jgi:LuxR family quorum sensing-dependent transcriptional regulator
MGLSLKRYARFAFDAIDTIERLTTQDEVVARMSNVLGNFGFTSFLIASTRLTTVGKPVPRFHANGWPQEWADEYLRNKFFADDPVAMYSLSAIHPFEWADVSFADERWPRGKKIMGMAAEVGMRNGFVVPVVGSDIAAAVTMAGAAPDLDVDAKRAIYLIGMFAHAKAMALESQRIPRRVLTERERDVVAWVAAGKSAWDISQIVGVSEAAVVKRLKNAMRKLDASTRAQAVAYAIRSKEITV